MKVIAIKPGYHGKLREVGEPFDVPEGAKATWFVPADAEPAKAPKPAKAQKSDDLV